MHRKGIPDDLTWRGLPWKLISLIYISLPPPQITDSNNLDSY